MFMQFWLHFLNIVYWLFNYCFQIYIFLSNTEYPGILQENVDGETSGKNALLSPRNCSIAGYKSLFKMCKQYYKKIQ